jgi:cytochrome c oxidase subunit II
MSMAVALILLVIGTLLFHYLSPWWFTPIASNWQTMDDTVNLTFWVTGVVFVAVNLFMAYAIYRYRHRTAKSARAHYEPENKKLEWWLTIVTTVGIAALLAPGLAVWAKFVTVPKDAALVEVLGQQWNWSYRFPGKDGKFGTTGAHLISATNPFGINPDDPRGYDDVLVTSPELHLPINQPVKLLLRSKDVNHQFVVPQFRVKMDMVPGMVTYVWLTPTRTGRFDALCEQLCGMPHFSMRGRVVVDQQREFDSWYALQPTYAQSRMVIAADTAAGQALYAVCSACHGAQAEGNRALNAPKLSGQASWYLIRQLQNFKAGMRGANDQDAYARQMSPFAALLADEAAVRNVVAYISSLPEVRPASTVLGNPETGKRLYTNCIACHGASGQGIWATNAPRLANMSDWYLQRQLQDFRHGLRGAHPQDFNGAQMAAMAKILSDERDVKDLLDYIHLL